MSKTDEQTLANDLRAALDGDELAYRRFLQNILPPVHQIINSKIAYLIPNDIDDVAQDVLFAIHAKRHTWQTDRPVLPWVYAIARYRCIDYARKYQRGQGQQVYIDDVAEEHLATETQHEARIDLPRAIAKLGGRLSLIAKAMGLEGKSVQQISNELGMSENAVRIAFHRAIKHLRSR